MSTTVATIVSPSGIPVQPVRNIAGITDLPSVWDLDATIKWLIDGMIPRGSVTLISAESGTGKTWLAYGIAGAVTHRLAFAGCEVTQTPVVYLDGENPLYVAKRNLKDLGIPATPNLRIWGGWNDDPPPGPDDERIIRFVRESDPKPFLIWDSLVAFNPGDEQSSTEVRAFMDKFRRLAHLGATVIVLHHTGKSSTSKQYRGSTDIKASVDMAYVLTGQQDGDGNLHRLWMEPFKSRIAPGKKFGLEFQTGWGFFAIEAPIPANKADPKDIIRRIVADAPRSNGLTIKKLARTFRIGKNTVDDILGNGDYAIEPGKGSEKLYSVRNNATLAPIQVPDFPDPGVREEGNSQSPRR